jgi:hypothetical protein
MNCDKTQVVDDSSWFTTMNCDKTQVGDDSSLIMIYDDELW